MADEINTFDDASVARIASTVRQFRPIPQDTRGRANGRRTVASFWAKVTASEVSGGTARHKAVEAVKDAEGQAWVEHPAPQRADGTDGVWLYTPDNAPLPEGTVPVRVVVEQFTLVEQDPARPNDPSATVTRDVTEWWAVAIGQLPLPQYVGDVLQAVAQNVLGAGPVQGVVYP